MFLNLTLLQDISLRGKISKHFFCGSQPCREILLIELLFFSLCVSVIQRWPLSIGWTPRYALVHSPLSQWAVLQPTVGRSVFPTQPVTSLTSPSLCAEASQKMQKYPKVYSNTSCLLCRTESPYVVIKDSRG